MSDGGSEVLNYLQSHVSVALQAAALGIITRWCIGFGTYQLDSIPSHPRMIGDYRLSSLIISLRVGTDPNRRRFPNRIQFKTLQVPVRDSKLSRLVSNLPLSPEVTWIRSSLNVISSLISLSA